MKKILFCVIVIRIALLGCAVQTEKPAVSKQRIISFSPNLTEIIYALGAQERLVAVSDFCNYPPPARSLDKIGGFLNPNLEKIITLKPDLLIGLPSHAELVEKIGRQKPIKSVLLPNNTLDDIFMNIDSLGNLFNLSQKADSLGNAIRDSIAVYKRKAALLRPAPKAMLVLGRDPGVARNIGVIGSGNFMDSLWVALGGVNVFGNIPMKFSQISREAIISTNPDIIIEFKPDEDWNDDHDKINRREWMALSRVEAVRNNQIFVLTDLHALVPGPRMYLLAKDYYRIMASYSK